MSEAIKWLNQKDNSTFENTEESEDEEKEEAPAQPVVPKRTLKTIDPSALKKLIQIKKNEEAPQVAKVPMPQVAKLTPTQQRAQVVNPQSLQTRVDPNIAIETMNSFIQAESKQDNVVKQIKTPIRIKNDSQIQLDEEAEDDDEYNEDFEEDLPQEADPVPDHSPVDKRRESPTKSYKKSQNVNTQLGRIGEQIEVDTNEGAKFVEDEDSTSVKSLDHSVGTPATHLNHKSEEDAQSAMRADRSSRVEVFRKTPNEGPPDKFFGRTMNASATRDLEGSAEEHLTEQSPSPSPVPRERGD